MPPRQTSPGAVPSARSYTVTRSTQFTASAVTGIPVARPAQNIQVLGFSVIPRAKGGTHAAAAFVLKAGATTVATVDATAAAAGVRSEAATIVSELVAAGVELTVDYSQTGGSSPTFDDVQIQVDYAERY